LIGKACDLIVVIWVAEKVFVLTD